MQDENVDVDKLPYKTEVLFGTEGEHHLSLYGSDGDSVLSYIHHLSHDEDLASDLIMGIIDTVPDDEITDVLVSFRPDSLNETLSYISEYPVKRYESMAQGLIVSERSVDEDGRTNVSGHEAMVGMVYNFGGDQKIGTAVTSVLRLFYEHRLYLSLMSAHTGHDKDELRTILLKYEDDEG